MHLKSLANLRRTVAQQQKLLPIPGRMLGQNHVSALRIAEHVNAVPFEAKLRRQADSLATTVAEKASFFHEYILFVDTPEVLRGAASGQFPVSE